MKHRNLIAILLTLVGLSQILGALLDNRPLRGIGLASGIAPYTKVFCEADGYEAFAARFRIEGIDADGRRQGIALDPERYSRLAGPYNRRNVYGAALAFAPRLPDALRDSLIGAALADDSPLRRELGIPPELRDLRVVIIPREGEAEGPWHYPRSPGPVVATGRIPKTP